ncbi:MAG TPA: MBL fold metallo-hydrolase [Candidatus Binatia bacterium]|nr:MBL fold metallo-hydrolase [Candidatus Binatia bacterium]
MGTNNQIDVRELLAKVDAGEPLMVLDVRNDDEYEKWKIEGRREFKVAHIPYFDFIEDEQASVKRLPKAEGEVVAVCAKGGSSEMVAEILRGLGVPARNLIGGMIAYGEYLDPVRVPVQETERARFEIWQFNRRGKGCLSYAVVSGGEAVVVDPSRAVEIYESFLARSGTRLAYVLDTHVHADHISGGPELAARLGGSYFVSAGIGFDLRQRTSALKDGDQVKFGKTSIRVLAAPGHTPGSVCYLVADRYLLSGDTLFKKSVGRPDLGGHVIEWSRDLFHTLNERIAGLDASTVILPAHYADISEIGPDGVVSAWLGDLRRDLPELRISELAEFTEAMKRAVRTPPPEYAEIIDVNLGKTKSDPDRAVEWELGKNQCAASVSHGITP